MNLVRFGYAYLAPARGTVVVNGCRVALGDGIVVLDENSLTIATEDKAEVILVVTA
jgi:hypothetical protein